MSELHAFDLDHTLVKVNSSFKFGVFLYRQKHFSFLQMLWLVATYGRYQFFGMSVDKLHRQSYEILFHGRDRHLVASQAEKFVETHFADIIYQPAMDRLRQAQAKGHHVALFSTGPDFLVAPVAARLGVHYWSATRYPTCPDGRFNESPKVLDGGDKARLLAKLIAQLSLPKEAVTAYSDSILDLPFLRAAKPVAVRPDKSLRRLSRREKWDIL